MLVAQVVVQGLLTGITSLIVSGRAVQILGGGLAVDTLGLIFSVSGSRRG